MFLEDTVFVIGAGASAEFGFPVGWTLMQTIKQSATKMLTENQWLEHEVGRALRRRYQENWEDLQAKTEALRKIANGIEFAGSIDEFIDRHSENPDVAIVGKLFIANEIARAEASSSLAIKPGNIHNDIDWKKIETTWLYSFSIELFRGLRTRDVERVGEGLTIISFNYDRSLEFGLSRALHRAFEVPLTEAHDIVRRMNIIHPYGTLGKLPKVWHEPGPNDIPFGPSPGACDLHSMANSLLTWSETVDDATILENMRTAIARAKTMVFLGFGFARQNMKFFEVGNHGKTRSPKRIYSTGKGLPQQEHARLKEKIAGLYSYPNHRTQEHITIDSDSTCFQLLSNNMRNLTP